MSRFWLFEATVYNIGKGRLGIWFILRHEDRRGASDEKRRRSQSAVQGTATKGTAKNSGSCLSGAEAGKEGRKIPQRANLYLPAEGGRRFPVVDALLEAPHVGMESELRANVVYPGNRSQRFGAVLGMHHQANVVDLRVLVQEVDHMASRR